MNKQQANVLTHEFFSPLKNESEQQMTGRLLVAERLFQHMLEGVFITDTTGIIRFINPSFSAITGYGEEIIGQNPRVFQSGKHDRTFYQMMWKSIEQNGTWVGEVWNKKSNGELFLQQTTITKIKDDVGQPLYYASVITDITERYNAQQRLKEDLLLAKEVQKSALPQTIQNQSIHLEGIYLPSELLGGDMYAWYQIDDHRYGIMMIDVMGHGVASALVSMSVRALLRGIIHTYVEPERVLKELNDHVYTLFRDKEPLHMKNYYLTCVYALIDTNECRIHFASAGHPPALLLSTTGQITELNDGTIPLGMLKTIDVEVGSYSYVEKQTQLIFYTDGLIESEDHQMRQNMEQLKQLLVTYQKLPLTTMMKQIIVQQLKYLKLTTFHDDVTMVVAKL